MQKVSKQSLAMIALSILLAISIALTMTFAALSESKDAQGKITFTGSVSVAWSGTVGGIITSASDGAVSFTLDQATYFDITNDGADVKAALKENKLADLSAISVTFTNMGDKAANYSFSNSGAGVNVTYNSTYADGTEVELAAGKATTLTLNQIISDIEVPTVAATSYTFTITASIEQAA